MKIDGLENYLDNLQKSIESLNGPVSVTVLFPEEFMKANTNFENFSEFLDAGGFKFESQEDFNNIPEDVLNQHVAKTTKFSTWDEMKQCAGTEYIKKNLNL